LERSKELCFFFFEESSPAGRSYSHQLGKQHSICQRTARQNQAKKILADSTSSAGIRLTCLLLTISFIFVLCTLPISIRLLIADYLPTHKTTTRWQITQLCLTLLMYLNHTVRNHIINLNWKKKK